MEGASWKKGRRLLLLSRAFDSLGPIDFVAAIPATASVVSALAWDGMQTMRAKQRIGVQCGSDPAVVFFDDVVVVVVVEETRFLSNCSLKLHDRVGWLALRSEGGRGADEPLRGGMPVRSLVHG